jgi:hypothetical protein
MELCGFGNMIEIKDTGCGIAQVTIDNKSLAVQCLVISSISTNYADIWKVSDVCRNLMSKLERKLSLHEVKQALVVNFGIARVN